MFAPEEATALTERGLNHAARLTGAERVRLQIDLLALALHADTGPRRLAISEALQRAIVDAQAVGCYADAARGFNELSWIPFRANRFAEALEMSLDATRSVRDTDPETRARTLAYSAQCVALVGRRMAQAEQLAREALELFADKPIEITSLTFALALIREHQGDDAAAITLFRRASEQTERDGVWWQYAQCLAHLAALELSRGSLEAVLEYCKALRDNAARTGDSAHIPMGAALESIARRVLGEDVELEPALAALRAADAPVLLARTLVIAGECELGRGNLDAAARYANEAVAVADRSERESEIVLARCLVARIAGREPPAELATIDPTLLSAKARAAVTR
jgi:tetratricopeptide (TPR) repeat protein